MRYLMTASLLSSWDWYLRSGDEGEADALSDFVRTLKREPIPDNENMAAGRAFEDAVCAESTGAPWNNEDEAYSECVREVAEFVRGGCWQVKASEARRIAGQDFLLYGRLDVLKGAWIYDIKYSHTYEAGKYLASPQTMMYPAIVAGPIGIRFLVADGKNVFVDEYRRESIPPVEGMVSDFWNWMQANTDLRALYLANWGSKE